MADKSKDGKQHKLGTFTGVFIPTSLNIFSILMFLRFGFILGQVGVLGFIGMLLICYVVDLLTFSSLSAIATNGSVRGGGAYYLISRSLGAEFGGAIGVVYYLGTTVNSGMNSVGLAQVLTYNFGPAGGWGHWIPEGYWWSYLLASVVLLVVTSICLAGSALFARAGNLLFVVIVLATYSIPLSAVLVSPFEDSKRGIEFTGMNTATLKANLYPGFTAGADGSNLKATENWQSLFSILFPATAGIFAGASMSGDLKQPGKAIPRGTISGLGLTFCTYIIVILSLASTNTRQSLYNDSNIMQDTSIASVVIIIGELSVTFFGALLGVIGSAKMLQAIARDNIIPGLRIFGQGSRVGDEPRLAILITWAIAQVSMFADLNQLAALVAMSILLTFLVTNLACFLLKIGSAPNFRPSFQYFSWPTAAVGALVSLGIMIFADSAYTAGSTIVMLILFLVIHYATPPKAWGDVSQSLIYHQVRKYLLRLRQDHVKSWRPSVLLVINDPRRSFKLIQFCNSLKKGALFILGHVIVTDDFKGAAVEHKKQLSSWTKLIDFSQIKAFTNITISPKIEWGIRNLVLTSGLGGMRPNIVIMSAFNLDDLRKKQPLVDIPSPQPSRPISRQNSVRQLSLRWRYVEGSALPTDADKQEGPIDAQKYVTVLEDLLHGMRINVAIAKGFDKLELPEQASSWHDRFPSWTRFGPKQSDEDDQQKCIDLWPIQMSSFTEIEADDGREKKSVLTSNFDTYTLILQLGSILETVPSWSQNHRLRVSVFVEYEIEVEQERRRLESLLSSLRIQAVIRVYWLAQGDLGSYEVIVNGSTSEEHVKVRKVVDGALQDEPWWKDMQDVRKDDAPSADLRELVDLESASLGTPNWRKLPVPRSAVGNKEVSLATLKRALRKMKQGVSHLDKYHPAMKVKLSNLDQKLIDQFGAEITDDEESEFSDEGNVVSSSFSRASSPQRRRGDVQAVSLSQSKPSIEPRPARASASTVANNKQKHPDAALSESLLAKERRGQQFSQSSSRGHASPLVGTPLSPMGSFLRPSISRNSSLPKFTSRPVPPTHISHDLDNGPTISFADHHIEEDVTTDRPFDVVSRTSSPPLEIASNRKIKLVNTARRLGSHSDPHDETQSHGDNDAESASGFPFISSVPLSFNELPSRAQNLILNELMVQHSSNATVIFTTLPSPAEGTGESEEDSLQFLSDLEVLCQDLPPTLLVHCNTVTVTVSL